MCAGNQEFEYDCPSGLYFNPEILACDWAYNVECNNDSGTTENNVVTTEIATTEMITTEIATTEVATTNNSDENDDPNEPSTDPTPSKCSNYFKYNVIYLDWKINWDDLRAQYVKKFQRLFYHSPPVLR